MNNPLRHFSPRWRLRLLLAGLLLFSTHIVLWADPFAAEWGVQLVGAFLLSMLLLDLAARYRAHNTISLLLLAGIYGMAASLLLNPAYALADVPRTIINRVMGVHVVAGLVAFGALNLLSARHTRPLALIATGLLGIGWGVWSRWSLVVTDRATSATPLSTVFGAAVLGLVLLLVLLFLVSRGGDEPQSDDLRLTLLEWLLVAAGIGALFGLRLITVPLDSLTLNILPPLIGFCVLILWFDKRKRVTPIVTDWLLPTRFAPGLWLLAALSFLAGGVIGYQLPGTVNPSDPVGVLVGLFTGFGLVWLPALAIVLGASSFTRQIRTQKL